MAIPLVIRGMFSAPKPCPEPAMGSWIGFQIEGAPVIDLERAEVRGYQGLIRAVAADPSDMSEQDTSKAFSVALTTEADALNASPGGDVGAIRAILDARVAALGVEPRRTFQVALGGGGIGVAYESLTFVPSDGDIQAIMQIVLARAKALDVMSAYKAPGDVITMTVNGAAV
jgi:hypothetical protein